MNVKELIEKYEYLNHDCFRRVDTSEVLRDLKQLDKSQKPVVPQFVSDWYENHKYDLEYDIWEYILRWGKQQKSEFYEWMNYANNKPLQTLANMHQFGYTVEKEKRYRVVMPNVSSTGGVLTRIKHDDSWIWIDTLGTIVEGRTHTRKELEEAGFGWVFDCLGIEVEEVE